MGHPKSLGHRLCERCDTVQTTHGDRGGRMRMAPHGCPHGLPCQRMPGEKGVEIPSCPQCEKDKARRSRAQLVDDLAAFGGAGKDGAA
jgi:hypothetical protein